MKKLLQLSSLLMLTFGLNACLSDIDETNKTCQTGLAAIERAEAEAEAEQDNNPSQFDKFSAKINKITNEHADTCYKAAMTAMTEQSDPKTIITYLDIAFAGYLKRADVKNSAVACNALNKIHKKRNFPLIKCDESIIKKLIDISNKP